MSSLPALNSRQLGLPAQYTQNDSKTGTTTSGGTGGLANSVNSLLDRVSLSKNGIDLSAQGMADRVDELGNATIDVAQDFIQSFARQLFGDAANGATLQFDSASLETQSGFAALLQQSSDPDGVSTGAALSLNESSHFIGKGTITTADGQSFEFEIEVKYESRIAAAATQSSAAQDTDSVQDDSDSGVLPTAQLPDIAFPGSLSDLFKLLGRELQSDVPQSASANADNGADAADGANALGAGTLKLRLLNLINSATLLDAATEPTLAETEAKARSKALADAYGTTPTETLPVPQAADSTTPGPAAAE